ncbi:hypothetical protein V8E53_010926 [Lactarius tabidus]
MNIYVYASCFHEMLHQDKELTTNNTAIVIIGPGWVHEALVPPLTKPLTPRFLGLKAPQLRHTVPPHRAAERSSGTDKAKYFKKYLNQDIIRKYVNRCHISITLAYAEKPQVVIEALKLTLTPYLPDFLSVKFSTASSFQVFVKVICRYDHMIGAWHVAVKLHHYQVLEEIAQLNKSLSRATRRVMLLDHLPVGPVFTIAHDRVGCEHFVKWG